MRYFKYLMIGLLAVSFLAGTSGTTLAADTRVTKDIKGLNIRKAEIISLVIGTESDGTWTWTAVVKNTGTTLIKKDTMTVQGIQDSSAASGSILPSDLGPGKSVSVKRFWTRCCGSMTLKVDLWDNLKSPGSIISTKKVRIPALNLRVIDIMWDRSQKKWTATVKNDTNLAIKIVVQGVATHANPVHWVGAGGFTKVVPPNATVKQTGSWYAYQPGDLLGVELRYFDQKWCGGSGWCKIHYKQITLP
jgi:hypothetical protein